MGALGLRMKAGRRDSGCPGVPGKRRNQGTRYVRNNVGVALVAQMVVKSKRKSFSTVQSVR